MEKSCMDPKVIMARGHTSSMWGHVCWYLAAIFAVLGVIGDAVNVTLGLEPTSWFLLAIALFAASVANFIGWAMALYLSSK